MCGYIGTGCFELLSYENAPPPPYSAHTQEPKNRVMLTDNNIFFVFLTLREEVKEGFVQEKKKKKSRVLCGSERRFSGSWMRKEWETKK